MAPDPREELVPVGTVLAEVLAAVAPLPPVEASLVEAAGRVLAETVRAPVPFPAFDNAAMDGYAVRAGDVAAAAPGRPAVLPVTSGVFAGDHTPPPLPPGAAAPIATGAQVPEGADAVVPVEATLERDGAVAVVEPVGLGANVRRRGEDVAEGSALLAAGDRLGPGQIAAAAAAGRARLWVHPRPRVAVLSTGNEVRPPGAVLAPGQVHDAAGPALAALVREAGCDPRVLGPVPDDRARLAAALARAASDADAVLTVGGVSMGRRDLLVETLAGLGEARGWRIALRPGKPFALGAVGRVPVFGLPGNPAAALAAFEALVRPALLVLQGRPGTPRPSVAGELATAFRQRPGRLHLVRARAWREDGRLLVAPAGPQGAGSIASLAAANAWLVVPPAVERLEVGATVEVRAMWGEGFVDAPPAGG